MTNPPPIPSRAHKRSSSAVVPTTTVRSMETSPNILSTSVDATKLSIANLSSKISQSPLKSKLLKVITSVKNNVGPQVDSLLSLSNSNNSVDELELAQFVIDDEPAPISSAPVESPISILPTTETPLVAVNPLLERARSPLRTGIMSSPSLLHLSYKSTLMNLVSQQQSRSERSKFSLPLLDISPYPKLSDDISSSSQETYPISYDLLGLSLPGSSSSSPSTPTTSTLSKSCVMKQDITLQRFKPLPPCPADTSSNNKNQQQKFNKLSSILHLLSFSLPDIVSKQADGGINEDQYRDLTQYLNENGDRIKISQHIKWHLDQPNVNIEIVKILGAHYGFPDDARATSWMLMTGYLPTNKDIRQSVLLSKRLQYRDLVKKYFGDQCKHFHVDENDFERNTNRLLSNVSGLWAVTQSGQQEKTKFNELVQQVHIDVIRTRPDGFNDLFELKEIEQMSERILAIWSSENQDLSYFQGLNDLICPFLIVFLDHAITQSQSTSPRFPNYPSLHPLQEEFKLPKAIGDGLAVKELIESGKYDILSRVEADVYWCLSHLMSSVKTYATNTGCGLPAEEDLYNHFKKQEIEFSHFSFRWMESGIKLWDRYMCDKYNEGFSMLHICFCAALLEAWSAELLTMEFMELVQFLQKSDILHHSQIDSILGNAAMMKERVRDIL
eukprot:gene9108-10680_t